MYFQPRDYIAKEKEESDTHQELELTAGRQYNAFLADRRGLFTCRPESSTDDTPPIIYGCLVQIGIIKSGYYVDSRLITVDDLDMVGDATRVWCEKYSRESSCTRTTDVQALPFSKCPEPDKVQSKRPLSQCFPSALTKRRMKDISPYLHEHCKRIRTP